MVSVCRRVYVSVCRRVYMSVCRRVYIKWSHVLLTYSLCVSSDAAVYDAASINPTHLCRPFNPHLYELQHLYELTHLSRYHHPRSSRHLLPLQLLPDQHLVFMTRGSCQHRVNAAGNGGHLLKPRYVYLQVVQLFIAILLVNYCLQL